MRLVLPVLLSSLALASPLSAQDLPGLPDPVLRPVQALSERGLHMLAALEGCHVREGRHTVHGQTVPHVGYGHRMDPEDAARMRQGANSGIGEAEAWHLLRVDAEKAAEVIRSLVKLPLKPHQFDALVMLAFNVGREGLEGRPLVAHLNAGDLQSVNRSWMEYRRIKNKATGEVEESPALQLRRREENYLFRTGRYLKASPRNAAEPRRPKPKTP